MIGFIGDHRAEYGLEPICRVLPIAPSTFYDYKAIESHPDRASDRAKRDAVLRREVQRVWDQNFKVCGVRKVSHQMRREGCDLARFTVERLMRQLGIQGVIRGKSQRTTRTDKALPCPRDKVNRQFRASAPNMLWVSDFTYVSRSCRECCGNSLTARSGHVIDQLFTLRGQVAWVRGAETGSPSHRPCASGFGRTRAMPRAAWARSRHRAARSGS